MHYPNQGSFYFVVGKGSLTSNVVAIDAPSILRTDHARFGCATRRGSNLVVNGARLGRRSSRKYSEPENQGAAEVGILDTSVCCIPAYVWNNGLRMSEETGILTLRESSAELFRLGVVCDRSYGFC